MDLVNDCSDSESESGSSTNSESVGCLVDFNDFDETDNVNLVQVSEINQVCEDDITIEASCGSSSKTIAKDLTDDESDCDVSFMQDKFDELNIATVKEKNKIYEKLANVSPKCSKSTTELVKKNLSGKKNPVMCNLCGEYMDGELGLKIHKSRKHK